MGLLIKPYTLSIVKGGTKITIGSDKTKSQSHASSVTLKRNVNGSRSLSFKMYYQYHDIVNGGQKINPFIDDSNNSSIRNESTLELIYKGKTYYFTVKDIVKNSSDFSCQITAEDKYVQELAKNGYDVTLDAELNNNVGTSRELATKALEGTDWTVGPCDICVQTQNETLIALNASGIKAYAIDQSSLSAQGAVVSTTTTTINGKVLAFYSSCKESPEYFQFITVGNFTTTDSGNSRGISGTFSVDDNDNITSGTHYVIKNPNYQAESSLGFTLPDGCTFEYIVTNYKADRFVYSAKTAYFEPLKIYVEEVNKGGETYYHYKETHYSTPNMVENIAANRDFKSVTGWVGNYLGPAGVSLPKPDNTEYFDILLFSDTLAAPSFYSKRDGSRIAIDVRNGFINSSSSSKSFFVAISNKIKLIKDYSYQLSLDWSGGNTSDGNPLQFIVSVVCDEILTDGTIKKITKESFYLNNGKCEYVCKIDGENGTTDYQLYFYPTNFSDNTTYILSNFSLQTINKYIDPQLKTFSKNSKGEDIYDLLKAGKFAFQEEEPLINYLQIISGEKYNDTLKPVAIEEGFYVNRTTVGRLDDGDEYIFAFRERGNSSFANAVSKIVVADYRHSINDGYYVDTGKEYFNIEVANNIKTINVVTKIEKDADGKDKTTEQTYKCLVGACLGTLTENQMKASKLKTFLYLNDGKTLELEEFMIFKTLNGEIVFPQTFNPEPIKKETHYYFKKDDNLSVETLDALVGTKSEKELADYKRQYSNNAEKVRIVSVKESNYYNILQTIAENFEQWLDIKVRNDNGALVKEVSFKNSIGQDNDVGFRYGVNIKDINRTVDSKQVISKLIVKPNSNEFAENGFCTIARAKANPLGETALYDFSYYFHNGMLSAKQFRTDVYDKTGSQGRDDKAEIQSDNWNSNGYYERLTAINAKLLNYNEQLAEILVPLTQANADYQVAYNAKIESNNLYEKNLYGLESSSLIYDIGSSALTPEEEATLKDDDFTDYVEALATHSANYDKYSKEEERLKALIEEYESKKAALEQQIKTYHDYKIKLNQAFYKKYAPYIQEGTWIDESYVDDDKYYLDAQATLNNSCWPQITYNINVVDVGLHPQYSKYSYDVGDQTYVQDPSFFGYVTKTDDNGTTKTPRRQQIVVTETTEVLDDPTKNSIKIQTFKNQFQDLFKKITATVQSVKNNEGAYKKATELVEAEDDYKMQFLEGALNNAKMVIQNAANESVTQGSDGLTIKDLGNVSKQLRLTSGAIMFRTLDEDGEEVWKTGITPDGIAADYVTAGQLNTGKIEIMHKDKPMFRWDAKGITAYETTFASDNVTIDKYNTRKFTRFDKNGIYGVNGVDGVTWEAKTPEEVARTASYYLTWDGMQVAPQNTLYTNNGGISGGARPKQFITKLGRVDDLIFNEWGTNGIPKYNKDNESDAKFVKVFAVGDKVKDGDNDTVNEQFVLYSDGTLVTNNIKLTGSIGWTAASSPSKNIYAETALEKPKDGSWYNTFPEKNNPGENKWHQEYKEDKDFYYCHTDDGGDTWQGPFLITGKSIVDTVTEYAIANVGIAPDSIEESSWKPSYPNETPQSGQMLYIRMYDTYNNGGRSDYRYSVGGSQGRDGTAVRCYVESSLGNFINKDAPSDTEIIFTAKIFKDETQININNDLNYTWFVSNSEESIATTEGPEWKTTLEVVRNQAVYFTAEKKGE